MDGARGRRPTTARSNSSSAVNPTRVAAQTAPWTSMRTTSADPDAAAVRARDGALLVTCGGLSRRRTRRPTTPGPAGHSGPPATVLTTSSRGNTPLPSPALLAREPAGGRLMAGVPADAVLTAAAEHWTGVGLATGPADRVAAGAALHEAYRAAGRTPPRHVVWLGSPAAGALAVALLTGAVSEAGP